MEVIESTAGLEAMPQGQVLSIGNFDGVHLGHQEIIKTAKRQVLRKKAAGLAVMTFDPHPAVVLHPEKRLGVLTPPKLKQKLLERLGVDRLIVLKDSYNLLNLSPERFIDEFLMEHIRPVTVVEGEDFNFGYGRSGNIETLKQLAATRGFEVLVIGAKQIKLKSSGRIRVSSTIIRQLLEKGNVAEAAEALGRPYRLIGQTIPGRGKGRQLGFPTANINPTDQIIPDEGVYAGFVQVGGSCDDVCSEIPKRPAAFSIGRAKTFVGDYPLLIEAHILEKNVENLNGKWLAMDFIERIRGQKRFANETELVGQIARDCALAGKVLSSSPQLNTKY